MPLPVLPPSFSFINTFFILSLFFFPTYLSSDDAKGYKACEPFRCGNFSGISYPFWSSNQPDYCGHPKFKLDCQQDNLTIDIKSQKFQIFDIIPKSQIFKIARLDLLNDTCPKQYINVNLYLDSFNYTSNDDSYTLLYDCGPPPYTYSGNSQSSIPFSCLVDGDPHDGYLVPWENVVNFITLGCKNNITVPVLKEVFQNAFINGSPVDYVLEQGFDVGWRGVDGDKCDSCIQSGGRCGFNASINAFMCLCLNQQSYGEICSKNPELSPLAAPISLPTPTHTLLPPYGPEHEKQANHSTNDPRPRPGKSHNTCLRMDEHIHVTMLFTYMFTISFFLLTTFPQSHCQPPLDHDDYSVCREQLYNCGNLSNISYPFWGDNRPSHCGGGDPFKLNCQKHDNVTTIQIDSQDFEVIEINPYNYTMRMVRTDLAHDVCYPIFEDIHLNPTAFQYTKSVYNITIFYDCFFRDPSLVHNNFTCGDENKINYVRMEDHPVPEPATCWRDIRVPSDATNNSYDGDGLNALERVLGKGFEVNYTECVLCMTDGGGVCGTC